MPKAPIKDETKEVKIPKSLQKKEPKKSEKAPTKEPIKTESPSSPNSLRKSKKAEPKPPERKILWPEFKFSIRRGDKALTAEACKELLGWQLAPEGIKDGVFTIGGERVWLTNNKSNRPIYTNLYETYLQTILRDKWKFNGEPIIIGKTGLILDGQHTMLAVILAAKEWKEHSGKWLAYWKTEPTIDKVVEFGIDEDPETVDTINTGKSRSLGDAMYRSPYFADLAPADRRACAKMSENTIKCLWDRLGLKEDAYGPIRTHMESFDFFERHPRAITAIKHIHEENGDEKKISKYLSPGFAAGLLYLMGTSATDRDEEGGYAATHPPTEKLLDFKHWDKATNFWVNLAGKEKKFALLDEAYEQLKEEGRGSSGEKMALLVKAWTVLLAGDAIEASDLAISYVTNELGVRVLDDYPSVGGIDLGRYV